MRDRTLRKQISESWLTLPVVAIVAALFWVLPDAQDLFLWGGVALAGLMAYILVEWNNSFQLLRIRSQMISVTFLVLMAMFPQGHLFSLEVLPTLCLLLNYVVLFRAYGLYEPQGVVFHAFLFLSIGSLIEPLLLLLVPFLFFSIQVQLRALTARSLGAGFIGWILPYWFYIPYLLWTEVFSVVVVREWSQSLIPTLPNYAAVPLPHWIGLGIISLLALISILHFVRTSYNDKIRTRQYFYLLLVQELPIFLLAVAFPDRANIFIPLLLLNSTPFIAHYFALAKGRGMNLWFSFWMLLLLGYGISHHFNLWTYYFNS